MRTRGIDNRGFTLAEVLVATTISAFITVVAVGALKAVTDSSRVVGQACDTAAEVRFAARMIAHDLANLYRDPDPRNMKLVGTSQESDEGGPATLTFYVAGRVKARTEQPEGDIYEVEYALGRNQDDELPQETADFTLFRRLWPNPDRNRDPGGILTPIAENMIAFQVRFFDGKQWAGEWSEEMQSVPQLVEVTLATRPKVRGEPAVETFIVTFPRLAAREASSSPAEPQESGPQQQEGQGNEGAPASGEGR